jgi:hypothetical protein
MRKLLLISILVATIVIPMRAAAERNPRRALGKALAYTIAFNVVYWLLLLFLYPRLG